MTKKTSIAWQPLDLSTLPNCRFIACDPSLTATGLVMLEVHDGQVYVLGAEKVGIETTELRGWDDTFTRASLLKKALSPVLADWTESFGTTFLYGVHEAPPVGGGMVRTESSILAGHNFRLVCEEFDIGVVATVTAHSHKKLLSGNGYASKKEHGEAVKRLLPDIIDGKLVTNEALRDALSIGLYAANRVKK